MKVPKFRLLDFQDSFTPLHLAAKEGFLDIVRVLCLARSNVSRKTKVNTSFSSSMHEKGPVYTF